MPSSACYRDHRDLPSFPTRRSSDLTQRMSARPWSWCTRRSAHRWGDHTGRRCGTLPPPGCPAGGPGTWGRPGTSTARAGRAAPSRPRSEEHTSELQSQSNLVCRLLLATATTETYPLSLHDALPISHRGCQLGLGHGAPEGPLTDGVTILGVGVELSHRQVARQVDPERGDGLVPARLGQDARHQVG